jgi:hypothetical protein
MADGTHLEEVPHDQTRCALLPLYGISPMKILCLFVVVLAHADSIVYIFMQFLVMLECFSVWNAIFIKG